MLKVMPEAAKASLSGANKVTLAESSALPRFSLETAESKIEYCGSFAISFLTELEPAEVADLWQDAIKISIKILRVKKINFPDFFILRLVYNKTKMNEISNLILKNYAKIKHNSAVKNYYTFIKNIPVKLYI
jgi:hypothetical protein